MTVLQDESNGTVVEWLASEQEDMDKGWNYVFQVRGTEMFYTHAPEHPYQIIGMLKDKVYSEQFGHGNFFLKYAQDF